MSQSYHLWERVKVTICENVSFMSCDVISHGHHAVFSSPEPVCTALWKHDALCPIPASQPPNNFPEFSLQIRSWRTCLSVPGMFC